MLAAMLSGVASAVRELPAELAGAVASWNLCNEPYFPNATSPWSAASYASWLNVTYTGNVSALNAGWGTTYASFTDIGWWDLQVCGRCFCFDASGCKVTRPEAGSAPRYVRV